MFPYNMNKIPATFGALASLALLLTLTACGKSTLVSTNAAGHAISAELEGNHSIDAQTNRAIISSRFGSVTIEPARVRIDGAPWTRIPKGAPVELSISKHRTRVSAGPVLIVATSR